MPKGFAISKKRNSPNPINTFKNERGTNIMVIQIPTTSSSTTLLGSFPQSASSLSVAIIPSIVVTTIKPIKSRGVEVVEMRLYFSNSHKAKHPTIAPIVPGAKGEYPAPRAVAVNL